MSTTSPVARSASIVSSDEDSAGNDYRPSVTWSIFVTWIFPVLVIAVLTRFAVDNEASLDFVGGKKGGTPITIDMSQQQAPAPAPVPTPTIDNKPKRPKREAMEVPTLIADKPSSYIDVVQAIAKRRLDWGVTDADPMEEHVVKENKIQPKKEKTSMPPPRGASSDPVRQQLRDTIDRLRIESQQDPDNLYKLIELADGLRMYDVQYHDGGTAQEEAIASYQKAIDLAWAQRQQLQEEGKETNRNPKTGMVDVAEELTMPYPERSIDGILAALNTALGKVYFMANMFEKAIASYSVVLDDIEPLYLDAMSARGSARIIVGNYEGAAKDFWTVIQNDTPGRFLDVFTGLARVLQAKESAFSQGWEPMIDIMTRMIEALESQQENVGNNERLSNTLNRLYHVLFLYHDVKTRDTDSAWEFLTKSYQHKMNALPAWNAGMEAQKIAATKSIFHRGFWPPNVGSKSKTPIFIIGFVRSGSTLLERVLDAHSQIVGTGENSVFNGRLDDIRNKIVETSMSGDSNALTNVIASLADGVVDEMKDRWEMVASAEDRAAGETNPERYVDKMLTNYYNVGFIHMLFPNALILHVAREPMDTIFSAYKHEFPPGPLDYTSEFSSLAELYHAYRDLMEHWDKELPGRVTHVRYEDLVHDMPGVSRKIIEATGLEWDDSVLNFHKKKQAVNTLSTTQVRKGIYKDSLQAWRRYETHLDPLVKLIGARTDFNLKTTLKGYEAPSPEAEADQGNEAVEQEEPQAEESNEDDEQEQHIHAEAHQEEEEVQTQESNHHSEHEKSNEEAHEQEAVHDEQPYTVAGEQEL